MPAAIKKGYEASKYTDWIIKSVTEILENDDKHEFRLSIEKSTLKKKNIYFNSDGNLLREAITL